MICTPRGWRVAPFALSLVLGGCTAHELDPVAPSAQAIQATHSAPSTQPVDTSHLPTLHQPLPRVLYAELHEQSEQTDYSGPSGGGRSTLERPASDNDAIVGITIAERSDDPCYMRLHYKDVETGVTGSTRTFDDCEGDEGDDETRYLPEGAFLTGVRVCLNSDRDKLKGIQLIGSYAACLQGEEHVYLEGPTGCSSVFHTGGHDYRLCNDDQPSFIELDCNAATLDNAYIERTNCDGDQDGPDSDWEDTVRCPSGMVATGVKLNIRDSGGDRSMYNGVSLICDDLLGTE